MTSAPQIRQYPIVGAVLHVVKAAAFVHEAVSADEREGIVCEGAPLANQVPEGGIRIGCSDLGGGAGHGGGRGDRKTRLQGILSVQSPISK